MVKSFEKAIALFVRLVRNEQGQDIDLLSGVLDTPPSTLYRHLNALVEAGLIVRRRRGEYLPHPMILGLLSAFDGRAILADIARPEIEALSARLNLTSHLGVLENEMVTYLVKVDAGASQVFTREMGQLEAYCSGIGKVLLGQLSGPELFAYLGAERLPAMTPATRTLPADIAREIERTRARGYGIDDGEVHENLFCLAMPVRGPFGTVLAAVSVSSPSRSALTSDRARFLAALTQATDRISAALGGAVPARALQLHD